MKQDIEFRRISDSESPGRGQSFSSNLNAKDIFPEDESENTEFMSKLRESNVQHSVSRDSIFMKSVI